MVEITVKNCSSPVDNRTIFITHTREKLLPPAALLVGFTIMGWKEDLKKRQHTTWGCTCGAQNANREPHCTSCQEQKPMPQPKAKITPGMMSQAEEKAPPKKYACFDCTSQTKRSTLTHRTRNTHVQSDRTPNRVR